MSSKSEDAIEWGPEIAINGVRPAWLKGVQPAWCKTSHWTSPDHGKHNPAEHWQWTLITAIRLPADHWAYPVIAEGFEPWAGGAGAWLPVAAPEDWDDTKPVMFRDGTEGAYNMWRWDHRDSPRDIIGYHKKAEPAPIADPDTVTIKRMTEAEARKLWSSSLGGGTFVYHLWKLGLIREETLAERFARETGHEVTPAVEAALKWERRE